MSKCKSDTTEWVEVGVVLNGSIVDTFWLESNKYFHHKTTINWCADQSGIISGVEVYYPNEDKYTAIKITHECMVKKGDTIAFNFN